MIRRFCDVCANQLTVVHAPITAITSVRGTVRNIFDIDWALRRPTGALGDNVILEVSLSVRQPNISMGDMSIDLCNSCLQRAVVFLHTTLGQDASTLSKPSASKGDQVNDVII